MIPSQEDIKKAAKRVKPYVHQTPVLTSRLVNEKVGADVFFKCENFQRMGAFKMRGAVNAILQLSDDKRAKGVITHSSGNFAQALALASATLNTKAYVVMPENAPDVKVNAVRSYGAEVIMSKSGVMDRENVCDEMKDKTGATFLHPSNDINVILGQGTAAYELINETNDLDAIIAPVGGGGLLAGTSLATHYLLPESETIGGEPFGADDAYLSLKMGKIQPSIKPNTIADGLKTQLGDVNFPIIRKFVSNIIRVEEVEIIEAMRFIWERMKIVIEPSSAVAVAALFRNHNKFHKKRIGIIISGGNVDVDQLPF
ncbi:MAG TPA: pyridoxal-phosphate dependent enzyme [Bacteroidales bacterium]|nr:pyridoxal-phosphate dependent enzyme [Bacteroidales bacterium]